MVRTNLLLVTLLGTVSGFLSYAQDGATRETISYAGVKFLPVHWVVSVADRGKTVMLEDSSVWRICPHTSQAACRLWPGTLLSIEDRGSTYEYPYRFVVCLGNSRSYPLNAMCVKESEE